MITQNQRMSIFTDIISKYSKIKFDGYTFIKEEVVDEKNWIVNVEMYLQVVNTNDTTYRMVNKNI